MTILSRRTAGSAAAVTAAAVCLVLGGALLGPTGGAAQSEQSTSTSASAADGSLEALQARLTRLPGDHPGWAALGTLYVDRARTTADPSWYAKAQGAFDRSLQLQPEGNAPALAGLAALQAAQHEFALAEQSARQALSVNSYSASAYGVLTDALTELGRYDEAVQALQSMADLDPGFAAQARISYARELRGDIDGAREAMQRALDDAVQDADAAFALHHLGELTWNYGGDVAAASDLYEQGLRRDPDSLALQAARARALAASGQVPAALEEYERVTARVPVQQYLVEHAELLRSVGRDDDAQAQLDLVRTANTLLQAGGSVVDLEAALFEADHGTPEQALAAARAAYAERPANVFAADALGWALHTAGQHQEALMHANASLSLGGRPASFLYHRGMILDALGRSAEAATDLRAALSTSPAFSIAGAAAASERLSALQP